MIKAAMLACEPLSVVVLIIIQQLIGYVIKAVLSILSIAYINTYPESACQLLIEGLQRKG